MTVGRWRFPTGVEMSSTSCGRRSSSRFEPIGVGEGFVFDDDGRCMPPGGGAAAVACGKRSAGQLCMCCGGGGTHGGCIRPSPSTRLTKDRTLTDTMAPSNQNLEKAVFFNINKSLSFVCMDDSSPSSRAQRTRDCLQKGRYASARPTSLLVEPSFRQPWRAARLRQATTRA